MCVEGRVLLNTWTTLVFALLGHVRHLSTPTTLVPGKTGGPLGSSWKGRNGPAPTTSLRLNTCNLQALRSTSWQHLLVWPAQPHSWLLSFVSLSTSLQKGGCLSSAILADGLIPDTFPYPFLEQLDLRGRAPCTSHCCLKP